MTGLKIGGLAMLLAAVGLAAGIGVHQWSTRAESGDKPGLTTVPAAMPGDKRPAFGLPDLSGRMRDISEWDGRILLINFWATWCPPCRKEIPAFVDLQQAFADQGVQFLGIAIDDAEKVRRFVDTYRVNYPILVGSTGVTEVARRYGNRTGALPFTAIIDPSGTIVATHSGELSRAKAEAAIRRLIQSAAPP